MASPECKFGLQPLGLVDWIFKLAVIQLWERGISMFERRVVARAIGPTIDNNFEVLRGPGRPATWDPARLVHPSQVEVGLYELGAIDTAYSVLVVLPCPVSLRHAYMRARCMSRLLAIIFIAALVLCLGMRVITWRGIASSLGYTIGPRFSSGGTCRWLM